MENKSNSRLAKFAVAINFLSALGFFLTFLFQIILAKEFGASWLTDAYIGASTLPLIVIGTISSLLEKTFIPVFFEHKLKTDIWKSVHNLVTIHFAFLCIITVLFYLGAPMIINFILPGFSGKPYFTALKMLRMLLPILVLGGFVGLLNSFHYAQESFILPNLAPSSKWLTAITFIMLLKDKIGILSVPMGITAGYMAQFIILWITSPKKKGSRFSFDLKDAFFIKILILMCPLLIASVFNNISIILMRRATSHMGEGSVTCLEYAYNIITVLVILCIQGISVVIFPLFSKHTSNNNMKELRRLFAKSQRMILMIIVPVIMGLIVLRIPVIKLLFERGKFLPGDTIRIANLIFGFSGAFLGLGIGTIQSQIYYAMKNTKRMMFISFMQMSVFSLLLFISRNAVLIHSIAISFSAAILCGCIVNHFHLYRVLSIQRSDKYKDIVFTLKIFAGSFIMAGLVFFIFGVLGRYFNSMLIPLMLTTAIGVVAYIAILLILRISEIKLAISSLFPGEYAGEL